MDSYCIKQEKETCVPSFSSALLDAIYRSIDEADENMVLRNQTMKKKNANSFERSCRVEKWMEKHVSKKELVIGMKSTENSERRKSLRNDCALFIKSSSSASSSSNSSSGSGSGGGFLSSDVESNEKLKNYAEEIRFFHSERERRDRRAQQGSITRTKAKALKIYRDFKKLKQPISPNGGRVSKFLNSVFVAGNSKTTKNINEIGPERGLKSGSASNCSSDSASYTRSCLSRTPSSRGKNSNGDKRTVRFCPVSVIVDEDKGGSSRFKPNAIKDKNRQVDEDVTRELLMNFQRRLEKDFDRREFRIRNEEFDQVMEKEQDEEDEDGSCASSDLFELNNLSDIGNGIAKGMYLQELPVYETTSLHSNTVIIQ